MELFIALTLFIGLIACWLVLPGSTSTAVNPEPAPHTAPDAGSIVQQPA